jgi:hypothetical protein
MLNKNCVSFVIIVTCACLLSSCSSTITNKRVAEFSQDLEGIPWVETRSYDVYVYQARGEKDPILLYYGRHDLVDKVNGKIIDENRLKWVTNYRGQAFSDANLSLEFYDSGTLKKAGITSLSGAERAAKAAGAVLEIPDKLEERSQIEMKREKDRLQTEYDIAELRRKLGK